VRAVFDRGVETGFFRQTSPQASSRASLLALSRPRSDSLGKVSSASKVQAPQPPRSFLEGARARSHRTSHRFATHTAGPCSQRTRQRFAWSLTDASTGAVGTRRATDDRRRRAVSGRSAAGLRRTSARPLPRVARSRSLVSPIPTPGRGRRRSPALGATRRH
jgi:hypothetical protein